MTRGSRLGHALVLECLFGFALLLLVVMLVMTGFPTATQASSRAARLQGATAVARQALERRKQLDGSAAAGMLKGQADLELQHDGKALLAHYTYQTELASAPDADPLCFQVTVSWENGGREQSLVLLGACAPP